MTKTQSNLPRLWQEIAEAQQRDALASALAELRQIDEDIDYSFQQTMQAVVNSRHDFDDPEISVQDDEREKLRERKYEILARLFGEK